MRDTIITVGSVTYAIKCKKLLNKNGIRSKLIKVDPGINENGCTYGVEFPKESFYSAVSILRQENISYRVYRN